MRNALKKLDTFGPIGSGIGAFIGVRLLEADSPVAMYIGKMPSYTLSWYILLCLPPAILSYLFCICTHRKWFIFSKGSIGGFLGSFIGMAIGACLFPLLSSLGMYIVVPIFAALFSHIFHKKKKHT